MFIAIDWVESVTVWWPCLSLRNIMVCPRTTLTIPFLKWFLFRWAWCKNYYWQITVFIKEFEFTFSVILSLFLNFSFISFFNYFIFFIIWFLLFNQFHQAAWLLLNKPFFNRVFCGTRVTSFYEPSELPTRWIEITSFISIKINWLKCLSCLIYFTYLNISNF